jgi:hypothetical protein
VRHDGAVSSHYEVVFDCALAPDTPAAVLHALRWHLEEAAEPPAGTDPGDHAYPLLAADPHSRLPGGDTAELRRPTGGGPWELRTRNLWLDDDLGALTDLLDLIAPYAQGVRVGFLREVGAEETTVLTVGGTRP